MHLFDPLRPQVIPGHPALLLDGSAVPPLILAPVPEANNVRVSVMLRQHKFGDGTAYSYIHKVFYVGEIPSILFAYAEDPEKALAHYFGWIDKRVQAKVETPAPVKAREVISESDRAAAADLLAGLL